MVWVNRSYQLSLVDQVSYYQLDNELNWETINTMTWDDHHFIITIINGVCCAPATVSPGWWWSTIFCISLNIMQTVTVWSISDHIQPQYSIFPRFQYPLLNAGITNTIQHQVSVSYEHSTTVRQWSYLGCQTSDSASSSKFHHLVMLVELVSHSSNLHHWPLLALLVALVLY